jgi:hypothetical protein
MPKFMVKVPAAKYLENDAHNLPLVQKGDIVRVLLDTDRQAAQWDWISKDGALISAWEDDDYQGALECVLEHFGKKWEGA